MILKIFEKKNHPISSSYEGERLVTSFNPRKEVFECVQTLKFKLSCMKQCHDLASL
jgi:hypothetical protein